MVYPNNPDGFFDQQTRRFSFLIVDFNSQNHFRVVFLSLFPPLILHVLKRMGSTCE